MLVCPLPSAAATSAPPAPPLPPVLSTAVRALREETARLAAAAKDAVEQQALKPRLEALGLTPAAEGPATFARFLAAERAEMQALILAEGIRLD